MDKKLEKEVAALIRREAAQGQNSMIAGLMLAVKAPAGAEITKACLYALEQDTLSPELQRKLVQLVKHSVSTIIQGMGAVKYLRTPVFAECERFFSIEPRREEMLPHHLEVLQQLELAWTWFPAETSAALCRHLRTAQDDEHFDILVMGPQPMEDHGKIRDLLEMLAAAWVQQDYVKQEAATMPDADVEIEIDDLSDLN